MTIKLCPDPFLLFELHICFMLFFFFFLRFCMFTHINTHCTRQTICYRSSFNRHTQTHQIFVVLSVTQLNIHYSKLKLLSLQCLTRSHTRTKIHLSYNTKRLIKTTISSINNININYQNFGGPKRVTAYLSGHTHTHTKNNNNNSNTTNNPVNVSVDFALQQSDVTIQKLKSSRNNTNIRSFSFVLCGIVCVCVRECICFLIAGDFICGQCEYLRKDFYY